MEEDIKVLEEKIKLDKSDYEKEATTFYFNIDMIPLIENLINRNKELEKQMGKDLDVVYIKGVYDEKDKWKNKIREKIKELENRDENYTFEKLTSKDIRTSIITNLQKLLEE